MTTTELIILIVVPTILNVLMLVRITRNDEFLNPIGVFACCLAFVGTAILGIVTLCEWYNNKYGN